MAAPLLDTHAWIWWIEGDRRLPRRLRDTLDQLPRDERPYLSAISLWEVAMLVERGRVDFSIPLSEWLDAAAHARSVRLVPISPRSRRKRPPCQPPFIGIPRTASSSRAVVCSVSPCSRVIPAFSGRGWSPAGPASLEPGFEKVRRLSK